MSHSISLKRLLQKVLDKDLLLDICWVFTFSVDMSDQKSKQWPEDLNHILIGCHLEKHKIKCIIAFESTSP